MEKERQDKRSNLMSNLVQREQDRKEKIKINKEEKKPNLTKIFDETFKNQHIQILEKIKLLEERKIEQECVSDYLDDVCRDIRAMNKYLSDSTYFLNKFNIRKGLETIREIENKMREVEEELIPTKKFEFKIKANTVKTSKVKTSKDVTNAPVDVVDAEVKKVISFSTISCGFSNEKDKTLKLSSDEITKMRVELSDLENCTVILLGNPITIHINNVSKCKILCGPVSTSVLVEGCRDCDLAVACQQLRIHSTQESRFYIHVTSKAIIEDSSGVQFAPYNLDYGGIEEHYKTSGLDWSENKWRQIDDFNWLVFSTPSPNWKEIPEEERIQSWAL